MLGDVIHALLFGIALVEAFRLAARITAAFSAEYVRLAGTFLNDPVCSAMDALTGVAGYVVTVKIRNDDHTGCMGRTVLKHDLFQPRTRDVHRKKGGDELPDFKSNSGVGSRGRSHLLAWISDPPENLILMNAEVHHGIAVRR